MTALVVRSSSTKRNMPAPKGETHTVIQTNYGTTNVHVSPRRADGHLGEPQIQTSLSVRQRKAPPPNRRTKAGNGKVFVNGVNPNNERIRRANELFFDIANDKGGPEMMSNSEVIIARNAAFMQMINELEMKLLAEDSSDFNYVYLACGVKLVGSHMRMLGLKRRMKDAKELEHQVESLEDHLKMQGVDESQDDWDTILGESEDDTGTHIRSKPKSKKKPKRRVRSRLPD